MAKRRLLVLAALFLVASLVSIDTTRVVSPVAAQPQSTVARLGHVALGGVAVALMPVGALVGCGGGGGGPRPTSATAVPLSQ
jgi:hypothetical protein